MHKKIFIVSLIITLAGNIPVYTADTDIFLAVPGFSEAPGALFQGDLNEKVVNIRGLIDRLIFTMSKRDSKKNKIFIFRLKEARRMLTEKYNRETDTDFWQEFNPVWMYRCVAEARQHLRFVHALASLPDTEKWILTEIDEKIEKIRDSVLSMAEDPSLPRLVSFTQLIAYVEVNMFIEHMTDETLRRELKYLKNSILKLSERGNIDPKTDYIDYYRNFFEGIRADFNDILIKLAGKESSLSTSVQWGFYRKRLQSAMRALDEDIESGELSEYVSIKMVALSDINTGIVMLQDMLGLLLREWRLQVNRGEVEFDSKDQWDRIFTVSHDFLKQMIETSYIIRYGIIPNMEDNPVPNPERDLLLRHLKKELLPDLLEALGYMQNDLTKIVQDFVDRRYMMNDDDGLLSDQELVQINERVHSEADEFIGRINTRLTRLKLILSKSKGRRKYRIRRFLGSGYTDGIGQNEKHGVRSRKTGALLHAEMAERYMYKAYLGASVLDHAFDDAESYRKIQDALELVVAAGDHHISNKLRRQYVQSAIEKIDRLIGSDQVEGVIPHNISVWFQDIPDEERQQLFDEDPLHKALNHLNFMHSQLPVTEQHPVLPAMRSTAQSL